MNVNVTVVSRAASTLGASGSGNGAWVDFALKGASAEEVDRVHGEMGAAVAKQGASGSLRPIGGLEVRAAEGGLSAESGSGSDGESVPAWLIPLAAGVLSLCLGGAVVALFMKKNGKRECTADETNAVSASLIGDELKPVECPEVSEV